VDKTNQKKVGIKSIDIHAHIIPSMETSEKYKGSMPRISRDSLGRDVLIIEGKPPFAISKQLFDVDLRIKEMDGTSVDMQALSIMPPLIQYTIEPEFCIGYCRMQNEGIAEVVKAFPKRFVGLANVPLQVPIEAAKELECAMKTFGMKGAQISTDVNGKNLDSPELWPFYEKAQELGAFILCHPNNPPGMDMMKKYHLQNLVGLPFRTSLAIASLLFGGVMKDFPKLKICFSHGGGFAPYQRGRWEHGYQVRPECKEFISKPPSEYFKLLYFDTVTHFGPALKYLIESVGSDKVLLGSDYPFDMADPNPVATLGSVESISTADKERVLGGNAATILGTNPI
jgi:aminocarboxymuconate-semialdehyde decarboxylase